MKLYLTPGACSLADHIALHEAGLEFERVRVDLQTKRTEDGRDFNEVNPKGYVPALVLDDGQLLTENAAILCWVAERAPKLAPGGELGRIRLIEMLAFISTELHRRSAAGRISVRQRVQCRGRLSVRDAALGADAGSGPARAAARLLRPDGSASGRPPRAAARGAGLKARS
jgi:glutathione S-transferase